MMKKNVLTIVELKQARKIVAKIVSLYGDHYLPIFIKLNDEVEYFESMDKHKELALKMASG
jgi:hypothetical protein